MYSRYAQPPQQGYGHCRRTTAPLLCTQQLGEAEVPPGLFCRAWFYAPEPVEGSFAPRPTREVCIGARLRPAQRPFSLGKGFTNSTCSEPEKGLLAGCAATYTSLGRGPRALVG